MLKPTPSKPGLFSVALKQFSYFRGIAVSVSVALVFTVLYFSLVTPLSAVAATNNTINFQARLESASGAIVADGNYDVTFHLFNASSSGGGTDTACTGDSNCLWEESYTYNSGSGGTDARIHVANGYLTVNLGSITAFPNTINWDQSLWLTMDIGGTTGSGTITWDGQMSPRLALTAVPYAFRAGQLAQYNAATGYTSTLGLTVPTGGNQTFVLPDMAAAGTYTLLTNGNAIQLQGTTPGAQQTGNFNISGTGLLGTLDATGSTLGIGGSNATTITIGNSSTSAQTINIGAVGSTATASTINIGTTSDTTHTQTIRIGSTNQLANSTLISGGGTGGVTIKTGNGGTVSINDTSGGSTSVNIGAVTNDSTSTVNIGSKSGGTAVKNVNIGSTDSTSTTTIQGGSNGATATIAIQAASGGLISIGNGSASNTIQVGTGAAVQAVTAGSTNSTSTTTLQGGTGGISILTGNNASGTAGNVSIDTGTSSSGLASISIGSTNAQTVNIGGANVTGGQTINIGTGASTSTKIINIGSNGSTVGADSIYIGNTTASGTGAQSIVIGSTYVSNNSVMIQGGNNGSGTTAVAIQTGVSGGTTGSITIGANAVSNTLQIGTVNTNTGNTQNINIGNLNAAGTTNVTIGTGASATAGTTTLQSAGTLSLGNGVSPTINIQGKNGSTINVGSTGASTASSTTHIADTSNATGTQAVTIGSSANSANTTKVQAGATSESITNGGATFQTASNSATAFQVQDSVGDPGVNDDTTTPDLLSNPSFETGFTGWSGSGGASLSQNTSSSNVYYGNDSLAIGLAASGTSGATTSSYTSALSAGTYSLGFFAKGSAAISGLTASLGSGTCTLNNTSVSNSQFNYYYCSNVTTTGSPVVTITATTNSATLYLDAVQLESASAPTPYRADKTAIEGSLLVNGTQTQAASSLFALQVNTLNDIGATAGGGLLIQGVGNNIFQKDFAVQYASGSTQLGVNTTTDQVTINGGSAFWGTVALQVTSTDAGAQALLVKGAASQTASIFQVTDSSSNGLLTVNADGSTTIKTMVNGNTGFQVQNLNGNPIFRVDTATPQVILGNSLGNNGKMEIMNSGSNRHDLIQAITSTGGLSTGGIAVTATNNSPTAFQIQNSSGIAIFNADTSGNAMTFGNITTSGTAIAGTLILADGTTDGFGATLNTATLTASQTITLPNASGTICLTSQNCSTAGSGYILNQTATPGAQQTGYFNISGTGIAGTSIQTPILDTPSGTTTLNIGKVSGGNVTSIVLNQNTTINGPTGSTNTFQVTNNGGTPMFTVDGAGNHVIVGNPTNCTGVANYGRFCVGYVINGAASGGTLTNAMSYSAFGFTSGSPDTLIGQKVRVDDTASIADTVQGLAVDESNSTNTSANITGVFINDPSANAGNLIQAQSGGTDTFTVSNTGAVKISRSGIPLTLNMTATGQENGILFQTTGGVTGEMGIVGATGTMINSSAAGDLALKASGGNIIFSASSANDSNEDMRLTQAGYLGIGTGTTAATTSRLTVPWKSGDTTPTANIGSNNSGDNQIAVEGQSYSNIGVDGLSNTSMGVYGYSNTYAGVFGQSQSGSSGIFQANSSTNTSPTLLVQQQGSGTANLFEAMDSSSNDLFNIAPSGLTTIDTPQSPTALDVIGGIDQWGYTYPDAGGTYGGDYVELGECDINAQFEGCYTSIRLAVEADGNPTSFGHATVVASVYQQAAMASAPYVNITVDGVEEVITASDIVAVTTTNSASNTTVKLYAKYTENWGGYNYVTDYNNGDAIYGGWLMTSQGYSTCTSAATCYIATLPSGTQTSALYGDNYAGSETIQPATDGIAMTLYDASGTANADLMLQDDTSNRRIIIGSGSTASSNPVLLVLASGSGNPSHQMAGGMYFNSAEDSFRCYQKPPSGTAYWTSCDGLIGVNTTPSNSITNTTSTTFFSGGNGSTYTIPANDCQPGVTYLITARGWYDTTGTPTITYSLNFGSTQLMATGAMATRSNVTGEGGWKLEATIICDTTGTSGTVEAQGDVTQMITSGGGGAGNGTDANIGMMSDTSAQTIDTTANQTIKIGAQWSAASTSNIVQLRQLVVQRLGPD